MSDPMQEAFFEHKNALFSMLQAFLKYDYHAAEDVLQEVFCKMFRHFDRSRELPRNPRAFLVGMCRNEAISQLRRRATRQAAFPILTEMVSAVETSSPHVLAEQSETREQVCAALAGLRDKDRFIIGMRVYSDLRFDEIAEILQIKPNAANTQYRRALERLAKRLPHGVTYDEP